MYCGVSNGLMDRFSIGCMERFEIDCVQGFQPNVGGTRLEWREGDICQTMIHWGVLGRYEVPLDTPREETLSI